jgi:hypothetical protein
MLPEDLGDIEPVGGFQRRLGKAFLKWVNRRYGEDGVQLVRLDVHQGSAVWGVKGREG